MEAENRTTNIDPREFRMALGKYPTGVTIVTSADESGAPVGVTASSFNSVSLDPPLVLWSLAKSAKSADVFTSSGHFTVHVLNTEQYELANRFAKSGTDKFGGTEWQLGENGSPVISGVGTVFECKIVHQYEGGDHIIFVGEVLKFSKCGSPSLVFYSGRYSEATPKSIAC